MNSLQVVSWKSKNLLVKVQEILHFVQVDGRRARFTRYKFKEKTYLGLSRAYKEFVSMVETGCANGISQLLGKQESGHGRKTLSGCLLTRLPTGDESANTAADL